MGLLSNGHQPKIQNSNSLLTDAAAKQLRGQDDPLVSSKPPKKLQVKKVFSVLPADRRGFEEILYLDNNDQPLTALVTGKSRELVSIEEGW